MTLFLDDGDVRLYHGDALEQLRLLPDGCVDMVATSPPFYGLRDYGTGTWEGGDEGCDHVTEAERKPRARPELPNPPSGWAERDVTVSRAFNECHCGARRVDRQIGLEETPDQWVHNLVLVFRECRRVLADHGTLWVEIGDSYANGSIGRNDADRNFTGGGGNKLGTGNPGGGIARSVPGHKAKDLLGQPWLLAFALRADGWYLRSEIIWARPNPMPESVTDRPTKSHSTVFLLSKQPRYFYDADAIRQPHFRGPNSHPGQSPDGYVAPKDAIKKPGERHSLANRPDMFNHAGANARSVWTIPTQPTPFAHFATWPRKLVARMIQAGTSEHGCCPECGKPWVRETSLGPDENTHSATHPTASFRNVSYTSTLNHSGDYRPRSREHTGWSPSCDCISTAPDGACDATGHPWVVPCTVLDPFAGSGTTCLVARHHGRHAICIELNETYCQLAADRLSQLSLLTGDTA